MSVQDGYSGRLDPERPAAHRRLRLLRGARSHRPAHSSTSRRAQVALPYQAQRSVIEA